MFELLREVINKVHIGCLEQGKKVHEGLGSCIEQGKRKEERCPKQGITDQRSQ